MKRIMGEDVTKVSPTLGFIIKTIDYDGCVFFPFPVSYPLLLSCVRSHLPRPLPFVPSGY